MKKWVLFLMMVFMGCAYEGEKLQTYLDEPKLLLKDPHFRKYKDRGDALEKRYVQKEITYGEYLQQKKQLDEKYEQEVQERDARIQE